MALSIRESNDVNVLLDWLLGGGEAKLRGPVSWDDAREAAARLADSAQKTLGAGTHGRDVRERWQARNASGGLRRRRGEVRTSPADVDRKNAQALEGLRAVTVAARKHFGGAGR